MLNREWTRIDANKSREDTSRWMECPLCFIRVNSWFSLVILRLNAGLIALSAAR